MTKIYYNKQYLDKSDFKEVTKALKNRLITTGPYVKKFEDEIKKYLNVQNAISCSSGTSAIYLALRSIGLKKNDVIIIPAINFIASINVAKNLGAKIYLCDVDYNTGQITPDLLEACIKKNKLKKIKSVITMYLGGNPRNVTEFYQLKKKYKFYIIEDSCHALGAKYRENNRILKIGSCKHSDVATFSLHPVKSITSGEGGIITTNSSKLANTIKVLRSHGILRNSKSGIQNYWKYDVVNQSLNFRMSDLNAALAYSQLKKLQLFVNRRNQLAKIYDKEFLKFSHLIKPLDQKQGMISAFHLYIVLINFTKLKIDKDKFINILVKKKIFPQFHYIPIYKYKFYNYLRKDNMNFKNSEKYYKNALSLPIYYKLSKKNIIMITKTIKAILKKNEL